MRDTKMFSTTSGLAYANPAEKLRPRGRTRLVRQNSLPTSAGRRAQPQCKDVFKLEKLPTGEFITVPRQGELSLRRRHSTGTFARIPSMQLTANAATGRTTGRSEANVSFEQPEVQPWMRGNTRRFGNTGPWVANRSPANGGAPGLTEQQGQPYLAGTQSISNATYRSPFGGPPTAFEGFTSANTLRLSHEKAAPPVADNELEQIMSDDQAANLTKNWISSASSFEAEIVKKMVRDVNAKIASKKAWE